MNLPSPATVNPWIALKISGARSYLIASTAVVSLSLAIGVFTQNWAWVPRCGGVLVLFGVLLSLRRLFRLGPKGFDEPTESLVINGNQLNFKAIHQDIQRAGDNFAQVSGVALMTLGTLLASYSDLLLDWAFPFGTN
jgi:hypothetical protein